MLSCGKYGTAVQIWILILPGILNTQNRLRDEFHVSSEVERAFSQVGCARNNLQFSHGSTESEVISLDAGLRMDGISARDLWDFVVQVSTFFLTSTQSTNARTKKQSNRSENLAWTNVDYVTSNAKLSGFDTLFFFLRTMKQ